MAYNIRTSDNKVYIPSGIISIKTPSEAYDKITLHSYGMWAHGLNRFTINGTTGYNKFYALENTIYPNTDYLTLQFYSGHVNGINISSDFSLYGMNNPPQSYANMGSLDIQYANFGYGNTWGNYGNFFNTLFDFFHLKTRLFPTSPDSYSYGWVTDYYKTENFSFIFVETGEIDGAGIPTIYYKISSINGIGLVDSYRYGDPYDKDFMTDGPNVASLAWVPLT